MIMRAMLQPSISNQNLQANQGQDYSVSITNLALFRSCGHGLQHNILSFASKVFRRFHKVLSVVATLLQTLQELCHNSLSIIEQIVFLCHHSNTNFENVPILCLDDLENKPFYDNLVGKFSVFQGLYKATCRATISSLLKILESGKMGYIPYTLKVTS